MEPSSRTGVTKLNHILAHRLRTLSAEKLGRFAGRVLVNAIHGVLFPVVYLAVRFYAVLKGQKYRFGSINLSSIGGSLQLDGFLRRTRRRAENIRYVFVPRYERVINSYFYELMKRHVTVVDSPLLKFFLTSLARVPSDLRFTDEVAYIRPGETGLYPPFSWFNEQDHVRGKALLSNLGITVKDGWYVCFFARDNAYNEVYNFGDERSYNLTYHATRNSDIATYERAMKFVLDQGGYVIRMGMVVKKQVGFEHSRLIDYPFTKYQSSFADVYLMCHGKFVIGSESGITCLSSILDVPLGSVNNCAFEPGYGRKNTIFIPKLVKSRTTGQTLSISQYERLPSGAENGILHRGLFEANNLCYSDNSEEDILQVTEAMYRQFVESSEGFESSQAGTELIWPDFLRKYPELGRLA